jgi:hypothetical protein
MGWPPAKDDGNRIPPVLNEIAATTINGIYKSTLTFINDVTTELLTMWQRRRADPDLVPQPAKQWPEIPSSRPTRFAGYRDGDVPFQPDALTLNPILGLRLTAALLGGDFARTWNQLD